jgi:thiamine-monophosphate kinase
MCDVSDGLVGDLGHLAQASGVTFAIDSGPLHALGAEGVTAEDLLRGGEDHALAFTAAEGVALPPSAILIGRVTEGPPQVLVDGEAARLRGFEHFA